jgi:hypothetical protein
LPYVSRGKPRGIKPDFANQKRGTEKRFPEFCGKRFSGLPSQNSQAQRAKRLGNAQGIEAVSFFAAGKKDTSG